LLSPALSFYKNSKQFFEQAGKDEMYEDLEQKLEPQITAILESETKILHDFYVDVFQTEIKDMIVKIEGELLHYTQGRMASLTDSFDQSRLENALRLLFSCVD